MMKILNIIGRFFIGKPAKAAGLTTISAAVIAGGFALNQRSIDVLSKVNVPMQNVAYCASQRSEVEFVAYHGFRTEAEQRSMLARGVSWVNRSRHQDGDAIDVMAVVNGKGTWDHAPYYKIADAFYSCGDELGTPVTWGGEWKVRDMVHFELKK